MTALQKSTLIAIRDSVLAAPRAYSDLTSAEKTRIRAALAVSGARGFEKEQFDFVRDVWFPVSVDVLDKLNAACPKNTVIAGREDGGRQLYISADLLSESMDGTLSALLPILKTLPLTHRPPDSWPIPKDTD